MKCGIIRSLNQLDEKSAEIFYKYHYRIAYDDFFKQGKIITRMENSKKFIQGIRIILEFLNIEANKSKVIEIGMGGGWNLLPYKELGLNCFGCDYDENLLKIAEKYGINTIKGGLDEFPIMCAEREFDILILIEVLEHTINPFEFIKKCNSLLKHGGYLIIGVPPLSAGYCYWGGDLLGTLQNVHNYLFDFKILRKILEIAGFKLIKGDRLISNAIFKKVNSPNQLDNHKITYTNRGKSILRYLLFMERFAMPYWSLRKKIFPKESDYSLFNKSAYYHLIITAPDVLWQFIKWKNYRLQRKIKLFFKL
jgi:SAM-dependent methyltransferase